MVESVVIMNVFYFGCIRVMCWFFVCVIFVWIVVVEYCMIEIIG